jgi:hypothetical protein
MSLGVLLAAATVAAAAPPTDIGRCAWTRLPDAERDGFYAAWTGSLTTGAKYLRDHGADMNAAAQACAGRSDLPRLWTGVEVTAVAMQEAVLHTFASDPRITRATLDEAWARAPEAARQCTRAGAAKAFGIEGPPCPDPHAPLALPQALGVEPENLGAATQLLFYFNAGAQKAWADALITRFEANPPAPAPR